MPRKLLLLSSALLVSLTSACATERETVAPGKELPCPNGTVNAGNTILTMDCNTVVQYQGTEFQSSLAIQNWVDAGLSSAPKALRDVDQAATDAQVQFTQTCRAYNSCQVRADDFNRELARTQDQFRALREKISLLQASGGNPAVLRSTITEVYRSTVPAERQVEETLALNFTVQAKDPGSASPRVVGSGERLRTGAQLVFGIEVSQTAHVYVFQKHQNGSLDVLFPNPGIQNLPNPLPAKTLVRIPPQGQTFTLNNEDLGRENVYIAVSTAPLDDLEKVLSQQGGSPSANSVGPVMRDLFEAGTPECSGKSRGLELAPEDSCGTLSRGLELSGSKADPFFQNPGSVRAQATPGDAVILKTWSFEHTP